MRHSTKFCEDRSNRFLDMADFRFFKMVAAAILDWFYACWVVFKTMQNLMVIGAEISTAAAILDFGNFKFLTVGTLKRVELRLHAKFWRNRSKRG